MPITARGRPSCRVYRYFWWRGRVCIHAHSRTYVCVYVLVKLLGLEGRAVRVAWLVHGTEGDRYELQPLVRAPSSCPRAYLRPLTFFSLLLITFLLLFRPSCYFALSLRRAFKPLSWRFLSRFRLTPDFLLTVATAFANICVFRAFNAVFCMCNVGNRPRIKGEISDRVL